MAEANGKLRQITLSRLKAGEQPFLAWGYSYLKSMQLVQHPDGPGDNPEDPIMIPEEISIKIPIKSVGVAEMSDRIARKAPVAPTIKDMIRPGTEEAKALGLTHAKIVERENFADPGYKEELRKHNQRVVYLAVLAGLAVDLIAEDGTFAVESQGYNKPSKINNEDLAIEILKTQGISNAQFDQLYEDIQDLTRREQEKVDRE